MTPARSLALRLVFAWGALGSWAAADEFAVEKLDNWHQWRGPNAEGVAPHGDPPIAWDELTNIQWKTEIPGSGSSTPIVWGDRVFLLAAIDTGRAPEAAVAPAAADAPAVAAPADGAFAETETPAAANEDDDAAPSLQGSGGGRRGGGRRRGAGRSGRGSGRGGDSLSTSTPTTIYKFDVICIDRRTGAILWQRTAREATPHEGHHPSHGYASASPTTDGRRLFASFGSRGVFCFDFEGNLLWERDLGRMESKRGFGEGASPVVHGDSLVVNWDHEGASFVACLDANTGKDRWRQPRNEGTTWATPLVAEHAGRAQVIVNATGRTRSYDLATGAPLWQCGGQVDNPIPSPVARDGVVYCMTGYNGYAIAAIGLDAKGDVTNSDTLRWRYTAAAPYVSSPLVDGDLLYFTKGDLSILSCLEAATGRPAYAARRLDGLGTIYASPVGAGGRVYVCDRGGTTLVVERGPNFKVLSVNKLDDAFNASPAVVGNQLLLRGEKHLYSIVAKP